MVGKTLDLAYYDELCWEESDLDVWFKKNYQKLGFSEIKDSINCADYIGIRNGKGVLIELEGPLWHINSHKQWVMDKIDVIICFGGFASIVEDKEIIRLIDYPEFLKEAVNPIILENIQKRNKHREEILGRFAEDERML